MKLTTTDIEAAFMRACLGESVNRVARDFNVTEGCLRWRFKNLGLDAVAVRRVADMLVYARLLREALNPRDRLRADRLVDQQLSKAKPARAEP